ncbi:MAG: hypothetical protein II258_01495 [Spirochaetales bacterium]|nr:hypothetical protein [Spirochaetales bacterium]MBQ2125652.1 hypothetical protein [Spirochaetales bacterium]MBQ2294030.1 hypothetical protein [Spirochaetales bacterium]
MLQPEILAKRIRANLVEQKEKLEDYLKLLDQQEIDINTRNADKLLSHAKVEKDVVKELSQLKIILEPLEKMYRSSDYKKDETLQGLKESIERLSENVQKKAVSNADNLTSTLDEIQKQIKQVRSKKMVNTNKVYSDAAPRMLNING